MKSLSDISLVAQVAVFHNQRAFDQLVRKYQSPVRRFLLNLTLGNEALSDDLAQDTFLKAYTHITQFQGVASFQTWLFRIAYNAFYDYKRKNKGIVKSDKFATAAQFPAEKTSAEANSSLFTLHSSLQMDIHTALAILKEEERACVTLQLIDGYSLDEIAKMLDMPLNTVKSHLRRGKEKLTTYLKNNGYDGNK
jgi:RNA polymerase sigma-70 factor (ECF subfamily)